MKKLIELDAALDALRDVIVPAKDISFGDESTDGYNDGIDMAVTVVSGLPTVDATPCDVCRYSPPSYGDGKPCTICPAEGKVFTSPVFVCRWKDSDNETE